MNDGVGGGGCVGEEMRTGGTRGGWRSLVASAVELIERIVKEKIRRGLKRP